ncbi:MAG: 7-carboxy-7-deazaguanine synthase QueE [Spirochaetota bacterium]|nr:7-carboxy-7-deazaguanine synthase QueE [Spirochaetota bacterium]
MPLNIPTYNLFDIFYSIQGEGFFTGRAAIFIRFSGCNLSCSFCDEPNHKKTGEKYTLNQLLDKIKEFDNCQFIVLTGGEPSIQPHLTDLVNALQEKHYFVCIETNGTNKLTCTPDWITVSPKTEKFIFGDELKLVYQNQDLKRFINLPFRHFFLQPTNFKDKLNFYSLERCIKIIKENPIWQLSLQMHKMLKIK